MMTAAQKALVPWLASIALILASPDAVVGQSPSSRPASVALTVVVPPHAPIGSRIIGRTSSAVELEALVGLGDRAASRIEVRLGPDWHADSTRVWVRGPTGAFEQLMRDAMIVALDAPRARTVAPAPLHFRVESARRASLSSLAIPVEYRLTVGAGDEIAVWTFPGLIAFDAASSSR